MAENVLIPLPGFALPPDFPYRIGFVELVNDQLRRLRATGHFLPPRFFGYYFRAEVPVGIGGSWTVSLDPCQPTSLLARMLDRLTLGEYSIVTPARELEPDFLLVHDCLDGACWLWSFAEGVRFVEAIDPTTDEDLGGDDAEQRKLLGP